MFDIKIIKENRKTISIKVLNDASVLVKCPKTVSNDRAMDFVNQKQRWILKNIEQIRLKNSKYNAVIKGEQSLVLGALVPYIEKREFERKAKEYLSLKTKEISQILGLNYNNLSFKNYKSRWGCCDAKKNVTLNYKLYMLDESTIKYVIVHELLHTIYLNHGKNFKYSIKNVLGSVTIYKNRLKEVGFLLRI